MPITVTTNDDEDFNGGSETDETNDGTGLSLREAFDLLNAGTSTGPIIFAAPGNTFFLNNGPLNVNVDITIDGDLDDNGIADISIINSLGQPVIFVNADNVTFHNDGASLVAEGTGTGNQFNYAIQSFGDNAAVINGGDIFADSDDIGSGERGGVVQFLGDDFSITNELGATLITTGRYAIEAGFSSDPTAVNTTIINHGYMEATDDTIRIASGTVTNSGIIRTTGTFSFGGQRQPGDIADGLSIVGEYDPGFVPDAAGLVVFNNLAGGFVDGFRSALFMTGGGTVNNAGTLEGQVVGIFAQDDFTTNPGFNSDFIVDNMAGGRIERTGGDFGFNGPQNYGAIFTGQLDSAMVTNAGIIQSTDIAISAFNAITLINLAGGLIRGDSDDTGDDAVAFRGSILDDFTLSPTIGFSFFAGGETIFSTQGYTISATGQLVTPAGDFDFPGGQAETAFLGRFPDPILPLVDLAATQTAGFVVYQTDGGGATLYPDSFSLNYPDFGTINITGFNTSNFEATLPNGDMVFDIPTGVDFNDNITNDGLMIGDILTGIGDDTVTNNDTIIGIVDLGRGDDVYDGTISSEEQTVFGGDGLDTILGGTGNDDISGGTGADILDGGSGIDLANYSTSASRIVINLNTGSANGGDSQGDSLSDFENVLGTDFNDILIGDSVDNFLIGGNGDDTLSGLAGDDILAGDSGVDTLRGGGGNDALEGGAGADIIDGTAGRDEASYDASTSRVVINLLNGTAAGGHAQGDTIINIDNLRGSDFNDVFNGNNDPNALIGGLGNDTLFGRGGRDELFGGDGNDTINGGGAFDRIDGGAGNDLLTGGSTRDVFLFDDNFGQDRITDFGNFDRIDFSAHDLFNSFADVSMNASQVGANVVIMLDALNMLTLDNVNLVDLGTTDFIF